MKTLFLLLATTFIVSASPHITYDNFPLGTEDKPLILRTYFPDPGLEPEYFANHHAASKSPQYNPNKGEDAKGEFTPIPGFPAAIGVNHGTALSYIFDTVECRVAYAWQGGFVDMFPYWGDTQRGNRISYDYVPRLVGTLFYKANPTSKLFIDGKPFVSLPNPKYTGYDIKDNIPTFLFSRGGHEFSMRIIPKKDAPLSLTFTLSSTENIKITYGEPTDPTATNSLTQTITGANLGTYQGYQRELNLKEASVANGLTLFNNLGCSACHSIDGSVGHGPTLAGIFNTPRPIEGSDKPVQGDDAYILESIKDPAAKTTKNFPPNYMPPYKLKDLEYESLLLYIKSLAQPE